MENTNVLFDRKRMVRLIVPLIVEQVLAVTVGMADMVMISGAGETAVSGISLVNTICVLLIVIFTSMASGGSVVGAQFLGSGDKKTACHAAEQLVMICGLIALVICGISFFGNRWILRVVYGSVEEQVMAYAVEYFFITSLSFPFLGIYNAGAALFRVMGNSNISMVTSIVMNALNIIGNAVFVFGFDMKVIANSRHKKTGPQYDGIEQVSMEEIFKRSDVISIHCPHTKETENLLNREAFAKMKDGVIIINTARGIIIDEEALLEALESRKVYMAGLDVVANEPPQYQIPLMQSPYTFITSHIAWQPKAARLRAVDLAVKNFRSYLEGMPTSVIN